MNTFIFGHRNPDTDSICSAISLSYLKNQLGEKTIAKTIGHLNSETKFVLKYFNVNEPQYLNDVKIRIRNIKYDKKANINENASIFEAYNLMQKESITALPLVDDSKKLSGFVTMKTLANYLVDGDRNGINTTLDNILKVIDGEIITSCDNYITGHMMLVGYQSTTFHDEIVLKSDDILVIGDRYKIIDYAIDSKIKLIILALNNKISKELIEKAKENNVNIIRSHMTSFEIANRIGLSNHVKSIDIGSKPITVFDDDFYDEFIMLSRKTRHNNYPVVDHNNVCLGMISLNNINEYKKQDVILVDHNNFEQSVEGIEEANIKEIIDHHNLGAIGTKNPISFRAMTVGCTSTIIYKMFLENKVKIPKNIAGLMLSAIISDTLLFTSPSTTNEDINAANALAKIAKVDLEKYGYKMLKASSTISGLTINEQIHEDYKTYTIGKLHIGLSQLVTMDFEDMYKRIDEYVQKLDEINELNPGVHAIFVTDIMKKGSYVIYNTKGEEIIKEAYNLKEIKEGIFLPKIMSRKKQMIPQIMEVLETK